MNGLGLFSRREAAALLRISPRHLWNLSAPRGPVPVVKIGGKILYRQEDLERFISCNVVTGKPKTHKNPRRAK